MLTTEPTLEMLQEWKRLHEEYRPKLTPNRKSGVQVDAYFREKYPHTPMDSEEIREMIAAEIPENPHHAEKLPEGCASDVRCYLSEGILVGIDLVTGHIHVESEDTERMAKLYDALFFYRGLDEKDLENAFLTAEYVKLMGKLATESDFLQKTN